MPADPIAQEFTESMDTASKHILSRAGGEYAEWLGRAVVILPDKFGHASGYVVPALLEKYVDA